MKDKTKYFPFLLFICWLLIVAGCRKNDDVIGDDFVGALVGFDVKSSDTASIISYTSIDDSISTRFFNYYYLGAVNDPDFGKTTSSIITQYSLPLLGANWDTSKLNIDSIVLQVKYINTIGAYGNKKTMQQFKVYELLEDLIDSPYRSNRSYMYDASNPIGSTITDFNHMNDSVRYTFAGVNVALPGHLRIKLNNPSYIQKFKSAPFSSVSSFQSYFKGLVILPETNPLIPGEGSIAYVDLLNNNLNRNSITSVVVYYNGVLKIEFPIYDTKNIHLNKFSHQHTLTIPIQPKVGGVNQNVNYVKGNAGLKTRILIPHLFDFVKNSNIALTSAELIIPVLPGYESETFPLCPELNLYAADSLGRTLPIVDAAAGRAFYGGLLSNNQYKFTITAHIQALLKEKKLKGAANNYGLNLFVPSDPYRSVLDTRPGKIKLKLSYTVIK